MLTMTFDAEGLAYRDITKKDLMLVLDLYNQNHNNIYATGIDGKMTIDDINQKYLEVLVNSHEFFVGVFNETDIIGVIKGRIDYENNEEAWISSILINTKYQNQGYGKKAIKSIIDFLSRSFDVKTILIGIIAGNNIGRNFWQGQNFNYVRTIAEYIKINNIYEDFIIMKKEIK